MICIIYASAGRSKLMADPKEFTLPDLLTFQTMYLCGVAYMADPALMPGMIKKTQVPPPGTAIWNCLWGPVQNDDDANLAFVAGYFADPNAAPESIFITIRGTDVDIDDIWGGSGRSGKPSPPTTRSRCRGRSATRRASPPARSMASQPFRDWPASRNRP